MECGSTYLTEVAQNRSPGDFCFVRIVAERRTITVNFYHEMRKLKIIANVYYYINGFRNFQNILDYIKLLSYNSIVRRNNFKFETLYLFVYLYLCK